MEELLFWVIAPFSHDRFQEQLRIKDVSADGFTSRWAQTVAETRFFRKFAFLKAGPASFIITTISCEMNHGGQKLSEITAWHLFILCWKWPTAEYHINFKHFNPPLPKKDINVHGKAHRVNHTTQGPGFWCVSGFVPEFPLIHSQIPQNSLVLFFQLKTWQVCNRTHVNSLTDYSISLQNHF